MGRSLPTLPKTSSDMMHNHNCHAYLLQLKPYITKDTLNLNQSYLDQIAKLSEDYDEHYPYGNLYSNAISALEDQLDLLYACAEGAQQTALDDLIFAIYHNDNGILEHTEWINKIALDTRPMQSDTSRRIVSELEDHKPINHIYPNKAESLFSKLSTLFSYNFKPQLETNLPSLKNYFYRRNKQYPVEYRFGTQAQRHNGSVRISPLFKRWLLINAQRSLSSQSTAHIYFNNLGLDRSDFDLAGSKERNLSMALHELEADPSLKIAVITLPASQSLMAGSHYYQTNDKLVYATVFKELLAIAEGKAHKSGISDFLISETIRRKLFGDEENQSKILTTLLTISFAEHGIHPDQTLSTAQKQAVWVHFIKFELTDYIVNTLSPDGYNFSCKDAIDRGALSSVYYNLMKSFQTQQPMQREEFERALDAAAANVKGRGMNFHRDIIWNALDKYVNAKYAKLINDPQQSWLIFWRDMNCPHICVYQSLEIRINQLQSQLNALEPQKSELKKTGNQLLQNIKIHYSSQLSGQRLLLELVSRTSQLLKGERPSAQSVQAYRNLCQELQINYPVLHIIAGLAETVLGILLFLPTLGYASPLITHGIATCKSGFFARDRIDLNKNIIEFSSTISPMVA